MTAASASAIGRYRWWICFLLFLATTINYIDRQILALLKPMLDVELGWTNTQYGNVNAVFQGAYAVSLLFFGWFVDRFGSKVGYAVSIVAWSIAALGHALVGSVRGFFIARIALGLGEGGNFPAAVKAVALWFPKRERAYATSLFNAGTNVGAIIAPAIVPFVAAGLGLAVGLRGRRHRRVPVAAALDPVLRRPREDQAGQRRGAGPHPQRRRRPGGVARARSAGWTCSPTARPGRSWWPSS